MPPLPHNHPPSPPRLPVPAAPSAPSPINGRPVSSSLGALMMFRVACSICCSRFPFVASAKAYELPPDASIWAKRSRNSSTSTLTAR